MKKLLLPITILSTLLLLPGCGTENNTSTGSTNIYPETDTTATEYDEEYYSENIPIVQVEVQGIRFEWENTPKTYYFYMADPEISEITKEYVIATGLLSDEWHAVVEPVTVKYSVAGSVIHSGALINDKVLQLTPAIPFSTDYIYESIEKIYIRDTKTSIEFTPEKFPSIELADIYWQDNYTYSGNVTLTDSDGNMYRTSIQEDNPPPFRISYSSVDNTEERCWLSSSDTIFVDIVE